MLLLNKKQIWLEFVHKEWLDQTSLSAKINSKIAERLKIEKRKLKFCY